MEEKFMETEVPQIKIIITHPMIRTEPTPKPPPARKAITAMTRIYTECVLSPGFFFILSGL